MAFRWLPDSEQYAHPRLSWVIEFAFDVVLDRMFRVEHDVPPDFMPPPGALVVSNHLRDSDAPILGTLLYRRKGLHMHGRLPFFAMREDLFQKGALANLLYACPRPVNRLLRLIPLMWLFHSVRTMPMRRLREFTWHDTLRELVRAGLGPDSPLDVFNARGQRELKDCLETLPDRVDAINPWQLGRMRVEYWGLRRLSLSVLRRLAPDFRATITQQLQDFARLLDAGHNVYFAAEGHVSPKGRFGRIRAGTWQLGRMTASPVPLLPFTLSYDPLGPGRTRVIVRMGDMLDNPDVDNSAAFADQVRTALVARRVVTPSHLLARFLCECSTPFAARELVAWMEHAKAATRDAGLELDPLFERMSLQALVDERLRWLRRKHLVGRANGGWHNRWESDTPPGWLNPAGVVRYLANALADFAPGLVRTLSP